MGKYCKFCDTTKELDRFQRQKEGKDGYRSKCKDCLNKRVRELYLINKYKILKRNKKSYKKYRDKRIKSMNDNWRKKKEEYNKQRRDLYKTDSGRILLRNRLCYKKNKESYRASARKHYVNNRKKVLVKNAEWREANRDKIKEYESTPERKAMVVVKDFKRRALKLNAEHDCYYGWVKKLKSQKSFTCHWCNKRKRIGLLNIDHVVPLSRGGSDTRSNVVASCRACNLDKGDKLPCEWLELVD